MNPEKFIGLQQQMKQNNADLGDFLKDLDSWSNDMKEKEQSLKDLKPDKVCLHYGTFSPLRYRIPWNIFNFIERTRRITDSKDSYNFFTTVPNTFA